MDKKFFKPAEIKTWVVVSYESQRRFTADAAREMVAGLVSACGTVGGWFLFQVLDFPAPDYLKECEL